MSRVMIIAFLFLILDLVSCSIPSLEVVPISYIFLSEVELKTSSVQGSNNHDFKDAWVYLEGKSSGVYELPRRIAVLNETPGSIVNLIIQAGIRENGISSSPLVYPFIRNFESQIFLGEGEELAIIPEFRYNESTKFRMIADFESTNIFGFEEDGDTTTTIVISEEFAATGSRSGKIVLGPGKVMEQASNLVYSGFPADGSPIYLEIDYRGNLDLDVGLIGINGAQIFKEYFVSLRSNEIWKKAYINFTELIQASNLNGYQIIIAADNSNNTNVAEIYVDNIKLLHF